MINFNKKNKDKGWNVRIQHGISLFGEHHFKKVNQEWFVGIQTGLQTFKLTRSNSTNNTTYSNVLTMTYAGYTFKPFKNNLYIKLWAGIGYTSKISGENTLNDTTYDISSITYFATLHIGYTF